MMQGGRKIFWTEDDNGQKLVKVSLGQDSKHGIATILEDDFLFLLKIGLRPNWTAGPQGYVLAHTNGTMVIVARVLLDASEHTQVTYKDGNTKNLRRENLSLEPAKHSSRRDRALIEPPKPIKKALRHNPLQPENNQ